MDIFEKLTGGELYDPFDADLTDIQFKYMQVLNKFNATPSHKTKKRNELMKKMFAEVGENCYIQQPMYSNWGGKHVHLGNHVYANFNLTLVDDSHIYIGDDTMIGPNVSIITAAHPIEPSLRKKRIEFNIPVKIGKNVWIGAGAVILPGVTIGDNSVIGAGSVVTKDIPSNVVAVGSPCKVMREIGEKDREFYYKDRKIDKKFYN